jgi:CheY-like chemotaxis protein
MLKKMGHQCAVAYDGAAALDTADAFNPSLILLDIGLPGMNGYTVAEQLRRNARMRGVVLAALTGYGEEQDRRRAKEAGFNQHFVKPIDILALQKLLDSLPCPATESRCG